jgi:hypothetical protein
VKLTTHLQLVPRARKCGSVHPLPLTPSWRSAKLVKHRDNFTLPELTLLELRLQVIDSIMIHLRMKRAELVIVNKNLFKTHDQTWKLLYESNFQTLGYTSYRKKCRLEWRSKN